MKFSSRQFRDVVVATPSGRIDHGVAQRFEDALLPLVGAAGDPPAALVVDFAGVEYISSVGLRVLMMASRQARARNARIAVAALQPVVAEIFAISRFDAVVAVQPSVRSALAAFSAAAVAEFDAAAGTAGS